MPNTVLHKRNNTIGVRPTPSDLLFGELAINTAEGRIFTKVSESRVVEVTPLYRWGEVPIGRQTIGTPGGDGFGIADPPLQLHEIDLVNRLIDLRTSPLGGGSVDGITAMVVSRASLESLAMTRYGSFSIGTPGSLLFGIGPVMPPGAAFAGIGPDAYNPVHMRSGSFC